MIRTQSATPLDSITVEVNGDVTDVWIRRNISIEEIVDENGEYVAYCADEVHGRIPGSHSLGEVAAMAYELWNRFDAGSAIPVILATKNVYKDELFTASGNFYKAIANIPRGAVLVEGKNVVGTSFEEQVNLLKEGE
jgi:hypothetical protein